MTRTIFYTVAVVAVIGIVVFVGLKFNSPSEKGIIFSLEGGYAFQEKIVPIKKGAVIFSISDEARFLVKSEVLGQGVIAPWSEVMFLTISTPFGGEIKKLSAKECKVFAPMDGDLKIQIGYNSELFNPLIDKVWTGKEEAGNFNAEALKIQVRNVIDSQYAKAIPELDDLPKPKPKSKPKASTVAATATTPSKTEKMFSQMGIMLGRLIGDEPEADSNQKFWDAKFDPKTIKEIEDRVAGAWSVGPEMIEKIKK